MLIHERHNGLCESAADPVREDIDAAWKCRFELLVEIGRLVIDTLLYPQCLQHPRAPIRTAREANHVAASDPRELRYDGSYRTTRCCHRDPIPGHQGTTFP